MAGGWMRWLSGKTLRKCIAWAKFFQAFFGNSKDAQSYNKHNTINTLDYRIQK